MTKINPNKIKESFIDENGKYHREDGPAVTKHGGEQRWYRHGKLHRDGGPALISPIEGSDGMYEEWYQNGKLHREDGPALTKINRRTMEKEFIWAFHGMEFVSPDGEMPETFPKDTAGLKNLNAECLQDIMMIAAIIERNPLLKMMDPSTIGNNIKLARENMKVRSMGNLPDTLEGFKGLRRMSPLIIRSTI